MISNLFKYSLKNTLRNKFLTISSILVLTLLMFFINILWLLEDVSGKIINSINSKMNISLYLKDEYTNKSLEVKDLISDIENLKVGIKVKYKTKEDLIEEWRKREPKLIQILEKNNPLPNTITISDVDISDYDKLNLVIENKMFILSDDKTDENYFANYKAQYKKIKQVTFILDLLKMWLYVVIIVFFVAIAVISYSVISNFVYYYRDEIYITKLVWGSNIFIYGPFVIQWIFYATISFLLNLIIFLILLKNLEIAFSNYYIPSISNTILLLEFVVFILIWAISWYFSSKKYIKKGIT